MPKNIKKKVIVIAGPTASGKSDLAVRITNFINSNKDNFGAAGVEVISADSRQVYKGMDIGTGKVPRDKNQRGKKNYLYKGVPHHMLDVASPKKTFTVANYKKKAEKIVENLHKKNIVPIICGGTGFYIDALVYDINIPDTPPNYKLRKKLSRKTAEELFLILAKKDPERASIIEKKNAIRLIRAIEIVEKIGKVPPKSAKKRTWDVLFLCISTDKETLRDNIHSRLMKRMRAGMAREVKVLHNSGVSWAKLDRFGLEYRYVSHFLRGLLTKDKMLAQLETEILRYAKRQMTWFKRNKDASWIQNENQAILAVLDFLS